MASETEHVQLAGFDTAAKTDKQNERLVSAFESTYRHATFFFARLAVLAPFFLLRPTLACDCLELASADLGRENFGNTNFDEA